MSVANSLNKHLFADTFERFRGMTLEQAAQGYGYPLGHGGGLHSPEEIDEIERDMAKFRGKTYSGPSAAERASETMSQHRPIEDLVTGWASNHREIMVGMNTTAIARDLLDLGGEIRGSARPPETKLYRGAEIPPAQQVASTPDMPLSFTEDPHVARSFAKTGGRGSIFHAQAGSVRGIYVPDYVKRQRTVGSGRREEREWLIDPASIT